MTKKTITLVLTEDCNFACKYCYLVHKNRQHRMSIEVARAAVDYFLEHRELFPESEAIWDFMGGEPLLEVELIEQVIDHVRQRAYQLDHPWFTRSFFSITTNGALYGTPRVQRLLEQHGSVLEVGLTIDGPEHVHDLERVFPDGSGTYRQVIANVPLWLNRYPRASTKVTVSPHNLRYLAESILHLFGLGIREVHANVVFENVWAAEHEPQLEEQLDRLGEAMLSGGLHPEHSCSFFTRHIGRPLDPICDNGNWCGPGHMIAVDADGNFYPCNRFMAVSLRKRAPRRIGSISEGLDLNRLRPFLTLTRSAQSPGKCMECEVASGCAWCQGLNYDEAETDTIFQRATHICGLHKARVRAAGRFWARADALASTGLP